MRVNTFKKRPREKFQIVSVTEERPGAWLIEIDGGTSFLTVRAYEGAGRDGGWWIRPTSGWETRSLDRPNASEERKIIDAVERAAKSGRRGGLSEPHHVVADFNTLDDLAEHAARELGATHILYVDDEIHIYFPRQDGLFEKAEVWQKDGYWHAQGPGSRVVVRKLPVGAKPIGSGREREEGPHSWKPGMMRASAESPLDVLRTLQPGDMVTVESRELPRPRKLVVTHVSQHADSVYVTSGQVRPGHRSGGRLHAHGSEVFYDATIQQRPVRVSRLTRTTAALAERRR